MIIFLYGPDTYRSRQKLSEIIKRYNKLHKSGLNLKYFDCSKLNFQDFYDNTRQSSMFKEKKMIILTNSFSSTEFKEKFMEKEKFFVDSKNIIVFYVENQISKKDPLFTFLKKHAEAQEFKFLQGINLKNWVKKEFEKLEAKIEDRALDKLIFFVDNNLWQMANEIKKLSTFKTGEEIKAGDVELLVKPKIESDIFKTIDAIASKDKKKALNLLKAHLEKGDSPFYLFSMINFQFRNLLIIKDLIIKNLSPFTLTDLHPFVVKKSYLLAKKFEISELKKIYQKIFEVDLAVKTGKIGPEAALELLIAEI
ncbi:MAG: DNA polymerase III subunit delta [Candidatus Nealsonbacteria bacterium]